MRAFAVASAICCGAMLMQGSCAVSYASPFSLGSGYGFGAVARKKVTLVRRLVPDVPLADLPIRVKVEGRADAPRLQTILETLLVQNGPRLSVNEKQPAIEIRCVETSYSQPREDFATQNNVTTVQFSGSLSATFQVVAAASGQVIIAGAETAQLGGTYAASADRRSYTDMTEGLGNVLMNLGNRNTTVAMPSEEELIQKLMTEEATDIASHLVLLSEQVEVMLAKGPVLDEANKRAQAGQWSDDLTMLEGTKSLAKPEEEAYRLYNIGVANEALAYKAEDLKSSQTFLEEASTAYGKALEDNPKEKYFLEPQNRIQTAMVRYRKMAEQTDARQKRVDLALKQAKASETSSGETVAGGRAVNASTGSVGTGNADAGDVLTNDGVLKMVKAKFPERMILSKIQSSQKVKFDTSVDGMIKLKQGGATDSEIQLMDQRMQGKPSGGGQ